MNCEEAAELISPYLDGELVQSRSQALETHLADCADCRATHDEYIRLKQELRGMKFTEPTEAELRRARPHIVIRTTRGVGWTLLVAFLSALVFFGLYEFIIDSAVVAFVKVAVLGVILGAAFLFASVCHQRIVESKTDKYKEVDR